MILRKSESDSLADAKARIRACALRVQRGTPRSLRGAARLGAATPRRKVERTVVALALICLSQRRTDSGVSCRNVLPGQERNLTCAFIEREAPRVLCAAPFWRLGSIFRETLRPVSVVPRLRVLRKCTRERQRACSECCVILSLRGGPAFVILYVCVCVAPI